MFRVQRIYDYIPQTDETGIFLDRLTRAACTKS